MARRHRLTTAASIVLALAGATLATTPKVNGKLEQIGPFRALSVWGTPQEMGFAHGYVLGDAYLAPAKEYYSHPKFLGMGKHRDQLVGLVTASAPQRGSARQGLCSTNSSRRTFVNGPRQ